MTREEARDILKCEKNWEHRAGKKIHEALDMAIEALEQQITGEWQQDMDGTYLCSECGSGYKEQPTLMGKPMFTFCPICGARMESEEE